MESGDFILNANTATTGDAYRSVGGGLFNYADTGITTKVGDIQGNFVGNYAVAATYAQGGAIYNSQNASAGTATIGAVTGDFTGNYVTAATYAQGGAIYNAQASTAATANFGVIDGSFIGNYAKTTNSSQYALGGAVFTTGNLIFGANGTDNMFSGNYTYDKRGTTYNALGVFSNIARTITFSLTNSGSITFNDQIETGGAMTGGTSISYTTAHNLNITGQTYTQGRAAGRITFNDSLINIANITVNNAWLTFGSTDVNGVVANGNFGNGSGQALKAALALNGSVLQLNYDLSLNTNAYKALTVSSISATGNSYLMFGANFALGASDAITATTANSSQNINLRAINLSGDIDVGNSVAIFTNTSAYLGIGNLNEFRALYDGYVYSFSYASGVLTVASKTLLTGAMSGISHLRAQFQHFQHV